MALLVGSAGAIGCGSEARSEARPQSTPTASARPRSEAAATESGADDPVAAPETAPPGAPTEPDFEAPFGEEPCPAEVRVRLAHRSASELPAVLEHAVAFRAEDGRHLRVVIGSTELALDASGRFPDPTLGQARFEMDAVRQRRRPLEPMVLGAPDSSRGGLSHVRIVTAGPLLTFGHRDVGRVELTEITGERVCGRIDLNDGYGRVRGAFAAPVIGPLPE